MSNETGERVGTGEQGDREGARTNGRFKAALESTHGRPVLADALKAGLQGRGAQGMSSCCLAAARGMLALCDAITHLGTVRDVTGDTDVDRALHHICMGVLQLPDELWAPMLVQQHVGFEEIRTRLLDTANEAARRAS